jgi:hypothetical protein
MDGIDSQLSGVAAQVLYAYAKGIDERDEELLAALVVDDVALTRIDGTRHGREAFLDLYREFWASPVVRSKHSITNVRATAQSDGTVLVDAYFLAVMIDPEDGRMVLGSYSDSLRCVGSEYLISHKRIVIDHVFSLQEV